MKYAPLENNLLYSTSEKRIPLLRTHLQVPKLTKTTHFPLPPFPGKEDTLSIKGTFFNPNGVSFREVPLYFALKSTLSVYQVIRDKDLQDDLNEWVAWFENADVPARYKRDTLYHRDDKSWTLLHHAARHACSKILDVASTVEDSKQVYIVCVHECVCVLFSEWQRITR